MVRDDAEATAIRDELVEVDALIGDLRRRNAELERVLAESNSRQTVLVVDRAELQYKVDELREQLDRSSAQLARIPGQNADLEATADSNSASIADLEASIYELQNRSAHADIVVEPLHPLAAEETPNNLDPTAKIDGLILEFLNAHLDWHIGIEKVSTNNFQFGDPINKKVFIKVVGEEVVARVGGGYAEVTSWLEEQRLAFLEAEVLEEDGSTPASRRESTKHRSSRTGGDRRRSSARQQ